MNKRQRDDPLDRRLRKFTRIEMENIRRKKDDILRLHYIYDRRKKVYFRLFWLLLLGINFSLLFYQLYDRVEHYLSEPTTVMTEIHQTVKMSAIPNFVLCSLITTQSVKEYPDCLALGHLTMKTNGLQNSSKIWELYDNRNDIELIYDHKKIETKENFTKFLYVYGTCTSINIRDENEDFLKHLKIRIKRFTCSRNPTALQDVRYFLQKDDSKPFATVLQKGGKWNIIFNKLTQLQNVNRKRKPCVDEETYNMCRDDCLKNEFRYLNYSCRYPFNPLSKEIPLCSLGSYEKIIRQYLEPIYLANFKCNCTSKCTKSLIYAQPNLIGRSSQWTEITFEAPQIELFIEVLAYSEISLACDIGGLLGLYFGWSILSIVLLPVEWLERRMKSKPSMKLITKDIIKEKVVKILNEELQGRDLEMKIFNIRFNMELFQNIFNKIKGKYCFLLVVFFITFPLLGKCLYKYFYSVPMNVLVELQMNKVMPAPIITFCSNTDILILLKNEFARMNNGTCDFTILDLMNKRLLNTSFTLEQLWDISISTFVLKDILPVSSPVAKESGSCTRLEYPTLTYGDYFYKVVILTSLSTSCFDWSMKFYFSSEEDVDDVLAESDSNFVYAKLTTYSKKYKYLNTSDNICVDNITYINCRENCRKDATESLNCRLPYMWNVSNLPLCDTTETAYESYNKHRKSIDKCSCKRKCLQTIYDLRIDTVDSITGYIQSLGYRDIYVRQMNNKVIFIEEEFSYSFIKLLADVGNILGITTGVSLMSLILYVVD